MQTIELQEYRFENPVLCSSCGGQCCKHLPGCCVPHDFAENKEAIREALLSGKYTIDSWDGDPREEGELSEYGHIGTFSEGYFVRPAIKGERGIIERSWGGECTFLTFRGCSLLHENRPLGCRALEPKPFHHHNKGANCVVHAAGKREAALAWLPYYEFLQEIIDNA